MSSKNETKTEGRAPRRHKRTSVHDCTLPAAHLDLSSYGPDDMPTELCAEGYGGQHLDPNPYHEDEY